MQVLVSFGVLIAIIVLVVGVSELGARIWENIEMKMFIKRNDKELSRRGGK